MADIETPIKLDRCSLCRSEYIRIRSPLLSLDYIRYMNIEDFRELVMHVLKENGYDVFESDKENMEDDCFILESHKAEKRRWHVESWSLFMCINREQSVYLEDVKGFSELLISDNAERGCVIATSRFTEDAVEFTKDKPIELIDGKGFLNLLRKASNSQAYCMECLKIPAGIRASLKKLRTRMEGLNRVEKEISGKWSAPFHLDLMLGEMTRKIKSIFKIASKSEGKRLETRLSAKIKNINLDVDRMTRDFRSFETAVREFSKNEE
jgi:hypothetical protein